MRNRPTLTFTIDADLLAWIRDRTTDLRRGASGFVNDACRQEQARIQKLVSKSK